MSLNPTIYAIIAVLIVIGSAIWYFNYSQDKIQELAATNAELATSVRTLQTSIEVIELNAKVTAQNLQKITSENAKIEKDMKEYMSIFKRHDLTYLAKKKPGLIEARINKGTKAVFKELEDETSISD